MEQTTQYAAGQNAARIQSIDYMALARQIVVLCWGHAQTKDAEHAQEDMALLIAALLVTKFGRLGVRDEVEIKRSVQ